MDHYELAVLRWVLAASSEASILSTVPDQIPVDARDLHNLLVGPLFLYEDVVSAILPGVVFLVLFKINKIAAIQHVLAMPALGYKSKLALGLLLAYVVGKAFKIPGALILHILQTFVSRKWVVDNVNEQLPLYDIFHGPGQRFIIGVLLGLFLPLPSAMQGTLIFRANVLFYLNTGLVLCFAAQHSAALTIVGIAFLCTGFVTALRLANNVAESAGLAIGNHVMSSSDDYEQRVLPILRLILTEKMSVLRAHLWSQENHGSR